MAPTTRSLKKRKSPASKRENKQKLNASEPTQDGIDCLDDDPGVSSDDSLSTDSEMEDLVEQTAARMSGRVHAEGTHGAKPKGSKSDTLACKKLGQSDSEVSLPFVLDANPNSTSKIRIEVNHVTTTISSDLLSNAMEERPDAIPSPQPIQTAHEEDMEEEEAFISLEPAGDVPPKEYQRKDGKGNLQHPGQVKPIRPRIELATELDSGLDLSDTYLTFAEGEPQKSKSSAGTVLMKSSQDKLLKKSIITPDFEKQHSVPPYREATRQLNRRKRKERESSTGQEWYNMAAAEMTDELRNDIKVLRMRSSLDPKRFYKHNDMTALPKFVQVGTVVESPADFYHSRIPKKQRKQTIVEELLADAQTRRYNKKKFLELQERSKRWGQRSKRGKKGKKKGGK